MTVSYLVSSYNKRPWLPAVLASVARERDGTGGEIVLVDDGSTDGSAGLCADFAAGNPFVRLTLQENRGIFAVTNQLTRAATQQWVRLVDSDDPLVPGSTAGLMDVARRQGWDYVFGRMRPYGPAAPTPEDVAAAPMPDALDGLLTPIPDPYRYAIREYNHVPSTTLFRRTLLDGCDPIPEHFVSCQDLALTLRLFERARVGRVETPVCWQLVGVQNRLSARESLTLQQTALILGEYGERHFSPFHKRMAARKLVSRQLKSARSNKRSILFWTLLLQLTKLKLKMV
jgi:glycosyltransferase involved in cell wall biosynthesis